MAAKPRKSVDIVEIIYGNERWTLLQELREKARLLLEALKASNIEGVVHGSVARGDVREDSDVDVFIPNPPGSFQIENALENAGVLAAARYVIQATPLYAMKAYIEINEKNTVSFPLMSLRRVEQEFYRFSGQIDLEQTNGNVRVSGVDKRLMFIEPTQKGHRESSIIGKEEYAARSLRVSIETVKDRVRALTKRDVVGRTGVFLKKELTYDETFEMVLKRLAAENPAIRRKLRSTL